MRFQALSFAAYVHAANIRHAKPRQIRYGKPFRRAFSRCARPRRTVRYMDCIRESAGMGTVRRFGKPWDRSPSIQYVDRRRPFPGRAHGARALRSDRYEACSPPAPFPAHDLVHASRRSGSLFRTASVSDRSTVPVRPIISMHPSAAVRSNTSARGVGSRSCTRLFLARRDGFRYFDCSGCRRSVARMYFFGYEERSVPTDRLLSSAAELPRNDAHPAAKAPSHARTALDEYRYS